MTLNYFASVLEREGINDRFNSELAKIFADFALQRSDVTQAIVNNSDLKGYLAAMTQKDRDNFCSQVWMVVTEKSTLINAKSPEHSLVFAEVKKSINEALT